MPDALQTLTHQTFEPSVRDEPTESGGPLSWLVSVGGLLPPWWSASRDIALRQFYPKSDHLLGALYAMISKVTTIPFEVTARDKTIARHVEQAAERTDNLVNNTEYLRGWNVGLIKFLLDHYTQDNGSFFQIIGGGRADKEIIGWPFGLVHMDAARMQRTTNPEYPCIYTDKNGSKYKVHYTRVIEMASMPSARLEMNGVGYCAISRSINVAQNLIDIATYEQEKLGSRPARMMLVGEYISTADIRKAFQGSNAEMDQARLTRFSRMVAIGNQSNAAKITRVDLASIPDGFDKDASTKSGMSAIALAFGVDFREFWPATTTGATKADAEVQAAKAKQKWAEVLQRIERVINQKFLPPHLEFKFDWHDEADNELHAGVEYTRAQAAEKNLANGALTVRVVREKWLAEGIISQAQFEYMELQDGRLGDGTDILYLFKSDSDDMKILLQLPLANPTDIQANDPPAAIKAIDTQLAKIIEININASRDVVKQKTRQAIAALNKLRAQYMEDHNGAVTDNAVSTPITTGRSESDNGSSAT